jgi:hypothetical protein
MPDNREKHNQVQDILKLVDDSRFTEYSVIFADRNSEIGHIVHALSTLRSMMLSWKCWIDENRDNKAELIVKVQALVKYLSWLIINQPQLINRYENWLKIEGRESDFDRWIEFKETQLNISTKD